MFKHTTSSSVNAFSINDLNLTPLNMTQVWERFSALIKYQPARNVWTSWLSIIPINHISNKAINWKPCAHYTQESKKWSNPLLGGQCGRRCLDWRVWRLIYGVKIVSDVLKLYIQQRLLQYYIQCDIQVIIKLGTDKTKWMWRRKCAMLS